ncbi:phospholipase D-like domain-containing protein [Actinomadura kijaniata]|uniref:phospholipase D-like domain-containing protein n=1 Tax=Actinomadura kijaniata TaxID=46161 RepID=UPI00082DC568|nr:phospholipase D-like domain-containing protein [Actinomadura kijaniata]
MTLATLKQRYFANLPSDDETTAVEFCVDGVGYLRAAHDEIALTQSGDAVYLAGWFFDPNLDLTGHAPGDPAHLPVADLLADKAHNGVDVRLVLNGAQYLGALGAPGYGTCYEAMQHLRSRRPPGAASPPLADRVLYDWSGAEMTGSNHQKAIVVRRNDHLVAFLAGIDINPLMVDQAPHNTQTLPGTSVQWGWHDGGVRLEGGAALAAYHNFRDRWLEASTLPTAMLLVKDITHKIPRLVRYTPPTTTPVPDLPAVKPPPQPNAGTSVQILRSRFKTKLNRPFQKQTWRTAGGGELTEVFQTLTHAIDGAQRYIYLEDQFLADHPPLPGPLDHAVWTAVDVVLGGRRLAQYSLFPHLEAAIKRGVVLIMIGSGYADPGDLLPGPKNRTLNRQLDQLAQIAPDRLAVWRLEGMTVHTKLCVIDDAFAAIGSANLQSRSMIGIDSELQAAIVSENDLVKDLRARLWAEHLGLNHSATSGPLRQDLDDLDIALGMWRPAWGRNDGTWFTTGKPTGFTPAVLAADGTRSRIVRAYVGPGPQP